MSLPELLIRHACGLPLPSLARERAAAGVLMLPVPETGFLKRVEGLEAARRVPGVEEVVITARPDELLQPLPEGGSYPGFVFARGATPQEMEWALRTAARHLRLVLAPGLGVVGEPA
ncbi:MAG: hypothetical protein KatS3mg131_0140 [Candidatus Tectimicrobiota bacterium]|nr:MAG: hypothetical protein KatS3mg131_0140 [Candidatus Tectomicrobia bacterium]